MDANNHLRSDKISTKGEGGIGRHFPGGEDRPIPHWVPDGPEEALILKSVLAAPHLLDMPGNRTTVQLNSVRQK